MKNLTIATRGSALALWQANHIKGLLEAKYGISVELSIIKTKGDIILDVPLAKVGGKGLFVKEIEEALINGSADLAVHSMKDVPMELPEGLTLAAVPVREDTADLMLSVHYDSLDSLPQNAVVGTSSLRRQAQLLMLRPDLKIVSLRGNVDTRLRKLNEGQFDAIVMAAAGIKVAKHGNRAASSKCGTADCLEALGVNLDLSPEKCVELLKEIGICFFFAQKYHTSMKYVGPIRKELGIRTVFNILGPLTNPATPVYQLLGVYDRSLVDHLARVLSNMGVKRGMVVYGEDKLDEISVSAPTYICEFGGGDFKSYTIKPEDFGLSTCKKEDLQGGEPAENAEITLSILRGDERGPKRSAVLLNAGAALYIGGKADSFEDGVKLAGELIDNGSALAKLNEFIEVSNR